MEKKKKNIRILFITPVSIKGAGTRCRIAQYIPYYKNRGIESVISPFYSTGFFDIVYKKGHIWRKAMFFIVSILRRLCDCFRALRFDIIYIYREACPIGPPFFEWIFSRFRPIIYDFDDAIYLHNTSTVNKFVEFMKYPEKVRKIIELSRHIIVCNEFLKDFTKKQNPNVSLIPIAIDTDLFFPAKGNKNSTSVPTIGWIGSPTTARYLHGLEDVFKKLALKHRFILKIVGADHDVRIPGVDVENKKWSLESEADDYQSLDIGICPLETNEWDLGKSAHKIVVYGACGVPAVASDTSSNHELIRNGTNGFLARSHDEWLDNLSHLVEHGDRRRRLGEKARDVVVKNFSVAANTEKYVDIFRKVLKNEKSS